MVKWLDSSSAHPSMCAGSKPTARISTVQSRGRVPNSNGRPGARAQSTKGSRQGEDTNRDKIIWSHLQLEDVTSIGWHSFLYVLCKKRSFSSSALQEGLFC